MFSNCCLTLQSQMVPPSLQLLDGNCYLHFYPLNTNILFLLTTQHLLLAVNCKPHTVSGSLHYGRHISPKRLIKTPVPSTRKVKLSTNLHPFNTQFLLTGSSPKKSPTMKVQKAGSGDENKKRLQDL